MPEIAYTEDTVLGGRVHLVQPKEGLRTTSDSLLLAAAIDARPGAEALEMGTGCGGALLAAAWRLKETSFTGVEINPSLADFAQRSVDKNGFSDRLQIETADMTSWAQAYENRFDTVFSNPPYFAPGSIQPPGPDRAQAYIESVSLEAWLKAMLFALKPRGCLVLIHRAAELARLLNLLDNRTGEITVLPVASFAGHEAKRVVIRARKGLKRGRVRLLAPLVMREGADHRFTPELQHIDQGGAIVWP